ncbi:uncharacterized protein GIQ15_06675 [Arthroderma uncinatum]|uniref:uncharacterized protein n=1 Tax=Arthroderma uncinatum TaxID=74035 RepID=UPI00144AF4AB|nr:uncharacterized protein GIQ15_06675 [Arthroderma uncinatum]KAF3479699.1 hypothetical protein GIQ15_06675 [Arthroderma uncinatum]
MVLLSSSTVGVALSSSIVGFFTLILFLSGYVLQQQSVRHIQVALQKSPSANSRIEPTYPSEPLWEQGRTPSQRVAAVNTEKKRNIFGRRTNAGVEIEQAQLDEPVEEEVDNERATERATHAVLHILTKPIASDICSTILLFETLASNSTRTTERILLYPQSWDASSPTKSVSSALTILKQASTRLNAVVQGIDTSDIRPRALSETQMIKKASTQLMEYERVMFLRSPGHLIDINKLEQMLTSEIGETMQVGSSRRIPSAWVPAKLSITRRQLPPALLVASDQSASWSSTAGKAPLPKPHVLNSKTMQQMNFVMESSESPGRHPGPAYVYFESDTANRGRNVDMHYTEWKKQIQSVCKGVNLGL